MKYIPVKSDAMVATVNGRTSVSLMTIFIVSNSESNASGKKKSTIPRSSLKKLSEYLITTPSLFLLIS